MLLQNDAADLVRKKATEEGYGDKQKFIQDSSFDWSSWLDASHAMSLFADKRLIELRLTSSKIGTEGSKAVLNYLNHPAENTVVLIITPRIEGQPKWVKQIITDGIYVPIYPLDTNQLPSWLVQRAKSSHQLSLTHDAALLLAERVEGNLMAAEQELEKLSLLAGKQSSINVETVADNVSDNARFSAFNMLDHAVSGNAISACRALSHIREEGTEAVAIIGAIAYQLRTLVQLKRFQERGELTNGFRSLRVIAKRQKTITSALNRLSHAQLNDCGSLASKADLMTKSGNVQLAWSVLEMLLMNLSGHKMPTQDSLLAHSLFGRKNPLEAMH